jgi:hypothetical protein
MKRDDVLRILAAHRDELREGILAEAIRAA